MPENTFPPYSLFPLWDFTTINLLPLEAMLFVNWAHSFSLSYSPPSSVSQSWMNSFYGMHCSGRRYKVQKGTGRGVQILRLWGWGQRFTGDAENTCQQFIACSVSFFRWTGLPTHCFLCFLKDTQLSNSHLACLVIPQCNITPLSFTV